jgi:hypothetical protein
VVKILESVVRVYKLHEMKHSDHIHLQRRAWLYEIHIEKQAFKCGPFDWDTHGMDNTIMNHAAIYSMTLKKKSSKLVRG